MVREMSAPGQRRNTKDAQGQGPVAGAARWSLRRSTRPPGAEADRSCRGVLPVASSITCVPGLVVFSIERQWSGGVSPCVQYRVPVSTRSSGTKIGWRVGRPAQGWRIRPMRGFWIDACLETPRGPERPLRSVDGHSSGMLRLTTQMPLGVTTKRRSSAWGS